MKRLRVSVEGKTYEVKVEFLDEGVASAPAASAPIAAEPAASHLDAASITSPLAAVVVSVDVAVGALVAVGQTLVTLEAMKMNTVVTAVVAGTVQSILVSAGDAVEEGQALISIA
jgi:glutaconyl-CoA/methylmalonyl-CoA decarboxylase subunit gamma